jgi:tetratricopeptide (TPR) repeat protein
MIQSVNAADTLEFGKLIPLSDHASVSGLDSRAIVQLDARFESGGVWAGVKELIETVYSGLSAAGQDTIIAEHLYELYMVLPTHRGSIQPKNLCLTDKADAKERTRFYAVDRAYRIVHGLVALVLEWRRALPGQESLLVIVRNFDQAQHLATRFFVELARRAMPDDRLEIIVETWNSSGPALVSNLDPAPDATGWHNITAGVDDVIANGSEAVLEENLIPLLCYYRIHTDRLAAARAGCKILALYNRYGYYYEAKHFVTAILPYFDQLVGVDEAERMKYVSEAYICLVTTGDQDRALRVVMDLAVPWITQPHLLAIMNYTIAIHHLRYAESRNIELAEEYILLAQANVEATKEGPESDNYPFRKAFMDNGLAFLRGRQGRHQEAIDLCQSGYEIITREMGGERHLLHRSVLQYNTAQVYVLLNRVEEGLEYYARAIGMDPCYTEYHIEQGNILQGLERYQDAIDSYELAIKCSPPYPEVYFNKAACHMREGQWEDALSCFATTLELDPNQPTAHALRGEIYEGLGLADDALADYDGAIALGDDLLAVRVNRAVLHYGRGSYDLALRDMDHVIARDPQNTAHYENRAAIYQAMNRQDLYLSDLDAAERYRQAA